MSNIYCTNYYDSTFLFFKQNVSANAILITSDEAYFHLSGFVNKKNFQSWSESNARELYERLPHNEPVTV